VAGLAPQTLQYRKLQLIFVGAFHFLLATDSSVRVLPVNLFSAVERSLASATAVNRQTILGMPKPTSRRATHPKGELEPTLGAPVEDTKLDTFGGRVEVLWDPKAEVTALGPLVYFIQFLKTSGLWERWVEECPLTYSSNNAPVKSGVKGGPKVSHHGGAKGDHFGRR